MTHTPRRDCLQGPFWVWMATLAGAMYAGYGLEWCVPNCPSS